MIVENELGGENRCSVCRSSMDRDVETTRVFLVTSHLDILKKTDELGDSPAEPSRVWLDENQLENVDDEEAPELGLIFHDDRARY